MIRLIIICGILFYTSLISAQISQNVTLLDVWNDPSLTNNSTGGPFNEVWGFELNNREYGVIGSTMGTHIIEVTNEDALLERDFIQGAYTGGLVIHRDYHDYNSYLYAICQEGFSTLQIMDLQYLPDSVSVVYDSPLLVDVAHNIFIDDATAKLYVCGSSGHAMSIYSLADPVNPVLLSHFDQINYVHDAYVRNDTAYLNCGDDGLYVYNFTNASSPVAIAALPFYTEQGYNHSGWLSEDGKTYVFADETQGKRMKVCDVSNLPVIEVVSVFNSEESADAMPHNIMLKEGIAYVAHYKDGLQIFDVFNPESPRKLAFYDTYPSNQFNSGGAWGIYTFLPSERILLSDRITGLHLFDFKTPPRLEVEQSHGFYPNPFSDLGIFYYYNPNNLEYRLDIYDITGKVVRQHYNITSDFVCVYREDLPAGTYYYNYRGVNTDVDLKGKFVIIK
jgi:choice-of-anchor B domain-containing protein